MPASDREMEAIRERERAATPGPWRWRGNLAAHQVWLGSLAPLKPTVMNFWRWGMQQARPAFNVDGIMRPPAYVTPEAHNPWFATSIDHPDARFIEHAREDVRTLLAEIDRLNARLERYEADEEARNDY